MTLNAFEVRGLGKDLAIAADLKHRAIESVTATLWLVWILEDGLAVTTLIKCRVVERGATACFVTDAWVYDSSTAGLLHRVIETTSAAGIISQSGLAACQYDQTHYNIKSLIAHRSTLCQKFSALKNTIDQKMREREIDR